MNFSLVLLSVLAAVIWRTEGKVDKTDKYDGIIQPLSIDGYKIVQGKANVKIFHINSFGAPQEDIVSIPFSVKESIPFELDLTKGAKDDNDMHFLDPMSPLKKSAAHMALMASTTKVMKISDDLVLSLGKKRKKDDSMQSIDISLPPSAPYIPKGSPVRDVDVPPVEEEE